MDIRRVILYMALALVSLSLWNAWQIDYPTKPAQTESAINKEQNGEPLLPQMAPSNAVTTSITPTTEVKTNNASIIHVKTDVLNVAIDLQQGDIVSSQLLAYPQSIEEKNKPFLLLQNQSSERYIASSNLFVASGQNVQALNFNFTSPQQQYELDPNQKQLVVTLNGKNEDGLDVKKNLCLPREAILLM